MADSKLGDLTLATTLTSSDILYVVRDPSGSPVDRRLPVSTLALNLPFCGCRVYRSAALSLVNSGTTVIAWDAESFDTSAIHDNSTNPSRLTLIAVGYWFMSWQLSYEANGTGVRGASLSLNGTNYATFQSQEPNSATSAYVHGSSLVRATAITDYVEVAPFQNSGGTRNFNVGSTAMWFEAQFLGV